MKRQDIERRPMPDIVIESLEPEALTYREQHADGVYLRVKPNGLKDWQLRYQREDGTWSWLELGSYGKGAHQLTGQFARQQAIELMDEAKRRGVPLMAATASPSPEADSVPPKTLVHPHPHPHPHPIEKMHTFLAPSKHAHFPCVSPSELPDLILAIRGYQARAMAIGLQLLMLLAVRPAELREAQWPEFDLEAGVWRVAVIRNKESRDFLLPLPVQAIELLHELHTYRTAGPFLFPGRSKSMDKPVGNMAFNHALDRLGYKGKQTPHGMRQLFSTAATEAGKDYRLVDSALAHKTKGVEGGCNTAQSLSLRRDFLQWWADRLDAMVAKP